MARNDIPFPPLIAIDALRKLLVQTAYLLCRHNGGNMHLMTFRRRITNTKIILKRLRTVLSQDAGCLSLITIDSRYADKLIKPLNKCITKGIGVDSAIVSVQLDV